MIFTCVDFHLSRRLCHLKTAKPAGWRVSKCSVSLYSALSSFSCFLRLLARMIARPTQVAAKTIVAIVRAEVSPVMMASRIAPKTCGSSLSAPKTVGGSSRASETGLPLSSRFPESFEGHIEAACGIFLGEDTVSDKGDHRVHALFYALFYALFEASFYTALIVRIPV